MQTVVKILLATFFISTILLHAQENQKVIDSTQNIEYLSQKIAKDYLFLLKDPKKEFLKDELKESILNIEKSFRFIAKNSKNSDAKDILNFLSYSKDQIRDILSKEISKENALVILDSTESLYEGAKSILKIYNYNFWSDLDVKISMMRILKLYMALHLNINADTNKEIMESEIEQLQKRLELSSMELNRSWQALKEYLNVEKEYFIPNIVYILTKYIEEAKR